MKNTKISSFFPRFTKFCKNIYVYEKKKKMRRIPRPEEVMSEAVRERVEKIQGGSLRFIIDPRGVTKFVIKEIGSKERFTVSIGEHHTCTCKENDCFCIHVLYILIKYFGIPVENQLLIKQPLSEHELDLIVDGKVRLAASTKPKPTYKTKSGKTKVKRQPITDEDVCPICYDKLSDCDKSKIAWCRCGCGGNFHRKCVKEWIDSRRMYGEEATCPICRTVLDMLGINAPPKKKEPSNAPPNLTPEEIRELMTRELSPDDYDLLLRLDQPRVSPQQTKPQQPKQRGPANARVNAAATILNSRVPHPQTPPDLSITGGSTHSDQRAASSAQNGTRPTPNIIHHMAVAHHFRAPRPEDNGFTGEILGHNAMNEESTSSQESLAQISQAPKPQNRKPVITKRIIRTTPRRTEPPPGIGFSAEISGQGFAGEESPSPLEMPLPPVHQQRNTRPTRPRMIRDMPKPRQKNPKADVDGLCVTGFKS